MSLINDMLRSIQRRDWQSQNAQLEVLGGLTPVDNSDRTGMRRWYLWGLISGCLFLGLGFAVWKVAKGGFTSTTSTSLSSHPIVEQSASAQPSLPEKSNQSATVVISTDTNRVATAAATQASIPVSAETMTTASVGAPTLISSSAQVTSSSNTTPQMKKEVVPTSQQSQWQQLYQQAMNESHLGDTTAAIEHLSDLLERAPNFKPARVGLANLLIKQEQLVEAQTIIDEGLAASPKYLPLRLLQAQMLLMNDKPHAAYKAIAEFSPSLEKHTAFYAFLAALQLRLNRPEEATRLYRQLLAVRPSNAVWWMGLGLSEEAQQNNANALHAYREALQSDGLNSRLVAYVNARLHALESA